MNPALRPDLRAGDWVAWNWYLGRDWRMGDYAGSNLIGPGVARILELRVDSFYGHMATLDLPERPIVVACTLCKITQAQAEGHLLGGLFAEAAL